jgi:hypothetical protein
LEEPIAEVIITCYILALEKLREEFKADNESLAQSEAISIMSLCDDLPEDKAGSTAEQNNLAGAAAAAETKKIDNVV